MYNENYIVFLPVEYYLWSIENVYLQYSRQQP